MKQNYILLICLGLFFATCKKKDNDDPNKQGNLKGVILNEFNQPILGAIVEIESLSTTSDSLGEYSFEQLDAKEYLVSVTKEPYLDMEKKILIKGGETVQLDFVLTTEGSFLQLSDSVLALNTGSGSATFHIESNTEWRIENIPNWLSFSAMDGFGNSYLEISYPENTENFSRADTIMVTTSNLSQSLIIVQYPVLELVSYKGIHGDEENEIVDSVYVLFNRPIIVEDIEVMFDYFPTINYVLTDNNHGVKFDFLSAEMGGIYPFTISVTDVEGGAFNEEINVPFYHQKIEVEGKITHYIFLNQDKEILFAVFNPSQLIHYSLETQSIIQTIDLSSYLAPAKLSYNPYNSLIYMMGSYPNTEITNHPVDRPDVYTLDMQTNHIEFAVAFEPDEDDHPDYPKIYPMNIGFTKLGYGVATLSDGGSNMKVKLIDSSNNDSIYIYPDEKPESLEFKNLHMNYDFTKVYLIQDNNWGYFGIFDATTQRISFLPHETDIGSNFITPNRKRENFYVGQHSTQYILDLNNIKSEVTHLSGFFHQESGDFSYIIGKESYVYFIDGEDTFYIIDYSTGEIIKSCNTIRYLSKLSTTIDGKYITTIEYNEFTDQSSIVFFLSDSFY